MAFFKYGKNHVFGIQILHIFPLIQMCHKKLKFEHFTYIFFTFCKFNRIRIMKQLEYLIKIATIFL